MNWLARYCRSSPRPIALIVWHDDGASYVTDSRGALSIREERGSRTPLPDSADGRLLRKLLHGEPPPDAISTTLGDLWAWLDHFDREPCDSCGATGGYFSHVNMNPMRCEECNGRGWMFSADEESMLRSTVSIAGAVVDAALLVWWLPAELGDLDTPCLLWRSEVASATPPRKGEMLPILHVRGGSWHVALMGLDPKRTGRIGRAYRTYIPGAGAWYMTRRQADPEFHPGTDWFIEHGITDLAEMWGAPESTPAEAQP